MMADLSTALELAITAAFDLYRAAVRFVLRMPSQPQPQVRPRPPCLPHLPLEPNPLGCRFLARSHMTMG